MIEKHSFSRKLRRVGMASLVWANLFLGGCASPVSPSVSETPKPDTSGVSSNLKDMILETSNYAYSDPEILQSDELYILYDKADKKLTPELLEKYTESLKKAYEFVTQKLNLKFPNLPEGKLPVVFNGPSAYNDYLYTGKVGTMETVSEEIPQYPCHANPVLYYQIYEEEMDQKTLTGGLVHELIHAYLRNTVGSRNEHHFLEVGATCNDHFLMEEAFANLAQYLYSQESGIENFIESYPQVYDDTNEVFRSQNFFPDNKTSSYGLWGFLADQIFLDPSMPDYTEFGQSLEAIVAEGLRRQQVGEQADLDEILFRFLKSRSSDPEIQNTNTLNQALLYWYNSLCYFEYDFPGDEIYKEILAEDERNIFPEEIDMANGDSILVTDMNSLGDFREFRLQNVPEDRYVKVFFPPNAFSLVARNETTGEIFANLNVFESQDGTSHEIHLPPGTTQIQVVSNESVNNQEGYPISFTVQ